MKRFVLALMTLILTTAGAQAVEVEIGRIRYDVNTSAKVATVIAKDPKYTGRIVIPDEIVMEVEEDRVRMSVTAIGNNAFNGCEGLTSITIPEGVTSIGDGAFIGCKGLKEITIPSSITAIRKRTFAYCEGLTSVIIPSSVTAIGSRAFEGCSGLTSVIIPEGVTVIEDNAFESCESLTSVTIPEGVTTIGDCAFIGCKGLKEITIPSSITTIGGGAFAWCEGLISVIIPEGVTTIGDIAFNGCKGLAYVAIPNSVTSIGSQAFDGADISTVISLIKNPFTIAGKSSDSTTFKPNTFNNATLYVPTGTIEKYKATEGWKDFIYIEESDTPPPPNKCEKPTIGYKDGQLTFKSATEDVQFVSEITDTDIKKSFTAAVDLSVTYTISVYAKKKGYHDSEVATATLCWIEVEPQKEGITEDDEDVDAVTAVKAVPVLIQSESNQLMIEGAQAGTPIAVYDLSGWMIGQATAAEGVTRVEAPTTEKVVVVRIGERSVKVAR